MSRSHDNSDIAFIHKVKEFLTLFVGFVIIDDGNFIGGDPPVNQFAFDFSEYIEVRNFSAGKLIKIAEYDLRNTVSEAYFNYYFDAEGVIDWSVVRSKSQSSENEIGILVSEPDKVGTVQKCCMEYIDEQRSSYLEAKAAYTPEEYEKYRDAEVLVYGNCVVYFILGSEDRAAAISAVESCLSD